MIKIEHGVDKLPDGRYRYLFWRIMGLDPLDNTINRSGFHQEIFTAPEGSTPEIGDFITGGVLQKREGYQVTEGRMKWPNDEGYHSTDWSSDHDVDTGWKK